MQKSQHTPDEDPPQDPAGEILHSGETEETLEDEIEGEELSDTNNPADDNIPLRIEEESKSGRFKRVGEFVSVVQPSDRTRRVQDRVQGAGRRHGEGSGVECDQCRETAKR